MTYLSAYLAIAAGINIAFAIHNMRKDEPAWAGVFIGFAAVWAFLAVREIFA